MIESINIEPEVINNIYSRLGISRPKEIFQHIVEENLIKVGYKMGYDEGIHKNQVEQLTKITSTMPFDDDIVLINGIKYKKVEESQPKTLQQMLCSDNLDYIKMSERQKEEVCGAVEKWISYFHPDDMSFENLTYCNAFFDALDKLRNNLYEKM